MLETRVDLQRRTHVIAPATYPAGELDAGQPKRFARERSYEVIGEPIGHRFVFGTGRGSGNSVSL
jgi:hypothetical protein